MNINLLEQPDKLREETEMPYVMGQTCRDWSAWSKTTVVPMIDSGL